LATICTLKCSICGSWCAAIKTKRDKPFLYCAKCGYGYSLFAKRGIKNFFETCQEIEETELIPETLAWYKKKLGGEIGEKKGASEETQKVEPGVGETPKSEAE